ncbi:MAG: nicotinate-nucleotide adenylyltransferase [Pirellulales bacterium]
MRLGVFGGTFDPVHYGHLLLAECCREQCKLNQVAFLPAAVPPHKQRALTAGATRIEMLELAIAGHEAFTVSRLEIDRGGVSYTVETLVRLREEDPEGELFLLLGADSLVDLPHWKDARRICQLAMPVVVARPGIELDFGCLAGLVDAQRLDAIRQHQVEMPRVEFSSTDIRQRVAARRSIRYRTPRAVERYIEAAGLYREGQA